MKNCLIATVDALRYDGIASVRTAGGTLDDYGLRSSLETDNMDRIVRRGTGLPFLHAPYGSTPTSTASLLSGLYPREHGAYDYHRPMDDNVRTLADYFSEAGYYTIIMNGHFFFGKMGLGDRFDEILHGPASRLVERIKELNSRGENVFAYYHTMDVHPPYLISEFPPTLEYNDAALAFANSFSRALGNEREFDRGDLHYRVDNENFEYMASTDTPVWEFMVENVLYHYRKDREVFEDPVEELAKLYVQGINRFDKYQFCSIADYVLDDPDGDETVFVLTSDHGQVEKELDSGRRTFYHRGKPREDLICVPGAIVAPDDDLSPITQHRITSLVDVAPTVLELCDIAYDAETMSGIDLTGTTPDTDRYVYADFCKTVKQKGSDPIEEKTFPLPGVLTWSALISGAGRKFYTDTLDLTAEDYDLPAEQFVRVVSEKLRNYWLPDEEHGQQLNRLRELNDDREDYCRSLRESTNDPRQELYNLTDDPLETTPLEEPRVDSRTLEDLNTHLSERFTVPSLICIDPPDGGEEDDDEQMRQRLEGFGYL